MEDRKMGHTDLGYKRARSLIMADLSTYLDTTELGPVNIMIRER